MIEYNTSEVLVEHTGESLVNRLLRGSAVQEMVWAGDILHVKIAICCMEMF